MSFFICKFAGNLPALFLCVGGWCQLQCRRSFSLCCGPTTQIRTYPKHTTVSIFGIRFQRRRHSFRPPGKSVGQERTAARSFRPKIWWPSADGMKLARCARSDSHSVRALRTVKSCPCGAGLHSNGRGAAPVLPYLSSDEADLYTTRKFFIICGSAFFVGAASANESRRKARHKTVREYR